MATCSVINQETKEPKLFFESDRGGIYDTLPEVLQNSDNSYNVGFKDATEDFQSRATFPIHSTDTIEGTIQAFIKNEYLKPEKIDNNTYEAVDHIAANILEETLVIQNPDQYERNGNIFTFGDFSIKLDNIENKDVVTAVTVRNLIHEMRSRKDEERPVRRTEEELRHMIVSFMQKLGFSVNAVDKIQGRAGDNIQGMINFAEKIINIAKGENEIFSLSEEFCHYIIEAWNQEEVRRMLQVVHLTREYAEHAESYRQTYSAQISKEAELEDAVRREVLGKMLAKSLMREFTAEGRNETEKNIFTKLINILRDFLNQIKGRVTDTLQRDIDEMAREVANRLYNQNLNDRLNYNIDPAVNIMYAAYVVNPNDVKEISDKVVSYSNVQITNQLENDIHATIVSLSATAGGILAQLKKLDPDKIETYGEKNVITRLEESKVYVNIINNRLNDINVNELVNNFIDVQTRDKGVAPSDSDINAERNRITEFRDNIQNHINAYLINMGAIEGYMQGGKRAAAAVHAMLERMLNEDVTDEEIAQRANHALYGIEAEQRDTGWFWENFGHVPKSSNLFVALAGSLTNKMHNEFLTKFNEDIVKLIKKLEPYRHLLPEFVRDGRFLSGVNQTLLENAKLSHQLKLLQKNFPSADYVNMDLQEFKLFLRDNKGVAPELQNKQGTNFWKFIYDDLISFNEKTWYTEDQKTEDKLKLTHLKETIKRENIWTSALFEDVMSRQAGRKPLNIELRKSRTSPINSKGDLKIGFERITFEEFKANPTKYPNIENLVSKNPNHSFDENAKDMDKVKDTDIVFYYTGKSTESEAQTAYEYMTWNRILKQSQKSNEILEGGKTAKEVIFNNFKLDVQQQIEIANILKLEGTERKKYFREFFESKAMVENSEEYYEAFSEKPPGIDFDLYLNDKSIEEDDKKEMKELRNKYAGLMMDKNILLSNHKMKGDYKEIDITNLKPDDKAAITGIEMKLIDLKNQIRKKFKDEQLEEKMYVESSLDNSIRLNQAAKDEIKALLGKSFEEASLMELEQFFLNQGNSNIANQSQYIKKKDSVINDFDNEKNKDLRKATIYAGMADTAENAMITYLIQNAKPWFKRYDASSNYEKFLNDIQNDKIDVEKMLENYIKTDGNKDLEYIPANSTTPIVLDRMVITPSFAYISKQKPDLNYLVLKYNEAETVDEKMTLYNQMIDVDVADSFKDDLSPIYNNKEKREAFFMMLDVHMVRLQKDFINHNETKKIRPEHITMLAQVRRTHYERIENVFGKGKFKPSNMSDWIMERFAFREDDYEDAYRDESIPMYGYYMLTNEERTEDVYHSLVWGLKNANRRSARVKYVNAITRAIIAIEGQNFGKVDAKNTRYRKMLVDLRDHAFYGKTSTLHAELNIPLSKFGLEDIKVDMAKVADWFRIFSVKAALMFSPITAMTNFFGGVMQNVYMSSVGHDLYGQSNTRAVGKLTGMVWGSVGDIGEFDFKSKINKISYAFGYHDLEERYKDSKYNKFLRILDGLGFAPMAMTNYPLEAQSMLSKLMEFRLIDGDFIDWKTFKKQQLTKNPGMKKSEIKNLFDKSSQKSAYDFLDLEDGKTFDIEKLKAAGYQGDIVKDKDRMMRAINDIIERTTMEIRDVNQAGGLRNPLLAFFISMKKWMVLATSANLSRERFDYNSMSEERGVLSTLGDFNTWKNMSGMFMDFVSNKDSLEKEMEGLSEIDKLNLRRGWVMGSMMAGAFLLAALMKSAADDDEEKDNYMLQLTAYMAMRNLNELSSSQIGIGQSYFDVVSAPIMAAGTGKNIAKLFTGIGDIGDEVTSGKYKGSDKYVASILKATWLKNLYTMGLIPVGDNTPGQIMQQTRTSYLHFNTNDALYSVLSLLPDKPEEDE